MKRRGRRANRTRSPLGLRVRAAREAAELTQETLGIACEVTQATIARIEGGGITPDVGTGLRLAKALGMTLDFLYSGTRTKGAKP